MAKKSHVHLHFQFRNADFGMRIERQFVTTQVVRFTVQDKKVQRFKGSAVQGLTVNLEP